MSNETIKITDMNDLELIMYWSKLLNKQRTTANTEAIVAVGNEISVRFYEKVVKHDFPRLDDPMYRTASDALRELQE